MFRPIFSFLVCVNAAPSAAELNSKQMQMTKARDAVVTELIDCSLFYKVAANCARERGKQDLGEQLDANVDRCIQLAADQGNLIGLLKQSYVDRIKASAKKVTGSIDGRCEKFSLLFDQYSASCKNLVNDPEVSVKKKANTD